MSVPANEQQVLKGISPENNLIFGKSTHKKDLLIQVLELE